MTPASSARPASGARTAIPRPVRAGGASLRSHIPFSPRRVSGPVKRPSGRPLTRHPGPARHPGSVHQDQPRRVRATSAAAAFLRSLPDHRWLDRLVRGRAWIPLMGVLLAGIVATQVEVLKLGASMGRWVSRSAALTSHNQALQASVAALSDDQRIERLAARMGMVMPAPTDVTFAPLRPAGGIRAAIGRIHAPDAAQFADALAASQAAALAQAPPPVVATVTPATSSTQTGVAATPTASTTTTPTTSTTPVTSATTPASTTTTTSTGTTQPPADTATGAPTQSTTSATESTGGAAPVSGGVSQTGG